jgi:two-component system NtrC family sensor kinase
MASAWRLLHFSRQLRSPAKAIPVNDLVAEAVELCRYRCEMDGLLLMSDLATDVGQINVPPGQIQQVVIAMVQNAREALSPEEGGSIQASTAAGDGVVRIEIEDDGEGVPEQLQERVFDLGYTTKESDQPAGIGLTIGRHLARAHGGDLKIESLDEGGGLQVLTLPRVED